MWCACFIGRPFGCCFTRTDGRNSPAAGKPRVLLSWRGRRRGGFAQENGKRALVSSTGISAAAAAAISCRVVSGRPNMSRRRPFPGQLRAVKKQNTANTRTYGCENVVNDVFVRNRGATTDAVLNVLNYV